MSVASPTLVPRSAVFPNLLPKPPQPHPVPLPRFGQRPARFNAIRDLAQEMDDLSDEEDDLDDLTDEIKKRGFNFLVPIGRSFTQHEEKNDADEQSDDDDDSTDSDGSDDSPSEGANAQTDADEEEDEEEDEPDLDADMVDMDEPLNTSLAETEGTNASEEMDAEDTGDFEIDEGPSSEA